MGKPVALRYIFFVSSRFKPLRWAAGTLLAVWLAAWGGFRWAETSRWTAEKFAAAAAELDLARLSASERERALQRLAGQLNRLPPEERRKVRLRRSPERLFEQMTDAEKARFVEATMPTGFKQMLNSFEQLPPERRQRALTNALRRLREWRDEALPPGAPARDTPPISEDLQKRILTLGLKTFYQESSAQTKVEAAPLLEEIQRAMESGRLFHGSHGPPR